MAFLLSLFLLPSVIHCRPDSTNHPPQSSPSSTPHLLLITLLATSTHLGSIGQLLSASTNHLSLLPYKRAVPSLFLLSLSHTSHCLFASMKVHCYTTEVH